MTENNTNEIPTRRNEIFAGPQQTEVLPMTKRGGDFELEIPTEEIPLPSMGKVYPPGSALYHAEKIEIIGLAGRHEDILTSRALHKKGTVISELIQACICSPKDKPPINARQLLAGDRYAIMVAIRATGYGVEYAPETQCSACEHKEQQTFNLANFPIRQLDLDPVIDGTNAFSFTFPMCKKNVIFKFLTGQDEEEMNLYHERMKKATNRVVDNLVTTRLQFCILSIDGIEDKNKIAQFVRIMPAGDSLALRSYINKHEPTIETKQTIVCSNCGNEEVVDMPLVAEFFFPRG